jgi:hypothetical protein
MHHKVALVQELESPREVTARPANPFSDGIELAALERKERENAVGFP